MTTFVLHGGKTSKDGPETDAFFRLFSQLVPKAKIKYLMCYWARPQEQCQALYGRDTAKVLKQTDKAVQFELVKDTEDLYQKLPQADGLYVAGGDAPPLEKHYPALKDLGPVLDNKVYLGSSMGAFMAAKNYVLSLDSQDENTVHRGLDLLPINVLCHWNMETKKEMKMNLLAINDPHTPILTLDEFQWVTIYG